MTCNNSSLVNIIHGDTFNFLSYVEYENHKENVRIDSKEQMDSFVYFRNVAASTFFYSLFIIIIV